MRLPVQVFGQIYASLDLYAIFEMVDHDLSFSLLDINVYYFREVSETLAANRHKREGIYPMVGVDALGSLLSCK